MRTTYQFNERGDKEGKWGMDATGMLSSHVSYDSGNYFEKTRGIEDKTSELVAAVGGFAELLISKGVITPQEFLNAIGAQHNFIVRDRKDDY